VGASLALFFRLDESYEAVGVSLTQEGNRIEGDADGTRDASAVARQVARILSLDVDGTGWPEIGRRDPVMGRLQASFPGARPVCFSSPYEAGAWGVLAQRVPMRQAAQLKVRLAGRYGDVAEIAGASRPVFPSPRQLLALPSKKEPAVPGLPAEKLRRLQAVAEAALSGLLDAEHLREQPVDEALDRLEQIRGIGPWTAQHILMRGAGLADALPTAEPRVLRGVALAYGLRETPDADAFASFAEKWRPFRMWAALLLVRGLAGTEGWHGPEVRGRRVVRPVRRR
jgi:DNA-3-methyladenine glycosylase II